MPGCLSGREALRSMKIQISDSQMKVKLTAPHCSQMLHLCSCFTFCKALQWVELDRSFSQVWLPGLMLNISALFHVSALVYYSRKLLRGLKQQYILI